MHEDEWAFALAQADKTRHCRLANYQPDELYRLAADERFYFMKKEEFSPVAGIDVFKTGGHTPGHLIVKILDGNQQSYFPGDLIPTAYHLNQPPPREFDVHPPEAKKYKTRILRDALKNDAFLFFYHSLYRKSGRLSQDINKQYVLINDKKN